jgi:hypothetical protein
LLEPILCGLLSQAPFLPKLQGHFAEFLDNASPAGLRILSSSTCVGLRYGHIQRHSGFSRQLELPASLLLFGTRHTSGLYGRFAFHTPPVLAPVFSFPGPVILLRPRSSDCMWCRNIHLLSIGYAFQPHLRPRLPQSRSALLWKPWIFGLEDSHLHLATHSGILSSWQSTAPFGTASSRQQCSSTNGYSYPFLSFGGVFQPRTFSAQDLSASELLRTLLMCGCF